VPYKDKAARNAHARKKRAERGDAIRAYHRKYQREYRAQNLKEIRAYQKEWARANRRKVRGQKFGKRRRKKTDEEIHQTLLAKRRRFYYRHRDQINAARKQERINDPERFLAIDHARYWRDPEKRRHQSRIARAKRSGESCYISLQDWRSLLARFKFRCAYCGTKLTKRNRSLDHKIPLVRGGTNEISNLVPSCLRCNQRKHSMTAEEFLRSRR
jgi:5-methylcytosine-specific restriction endonuclease McrA